MTTPTGMVDFHVHSGPSWFPRHGLDADTVARNQAAGFEWSVLKAHEGSTAERAGPIDGAVGGVVLNSPVGGANPEAVLSVARLGGRVVWMPTMSSPAHLAASRSSEVGLTSAIVLDEVAVVVDGRLRSEWFDVLDAVAAHDLVLVSGHLTCAEAVVLFSEASRRGVQRMLMNHPTMSFIGWDPTLAPQLEALGVFLEIGILPDCLATAAAAGQDSASSFEILSGYPPELWVFGSDLGGIHHPTLAESFPSWFEAFAEFLGEAGAETVMTTNPMALLEPTLGPLPLQKV